MPPDQRKLWPTALAWLVIGVTVAIILTRDLWAPRIRPASTRPVDVAQIKSPQVAFSGKYAVGMGGLLDQQNRARLFQRLDESARNDADRVRIAMLAGELDGPAVALDRLDRLASPAHGPKFSTDLSDLQTLYREGPESLRPGQAARLIDRHGWFGELALSREAQPNDPRRQDVLAQARRVVVTAIAGMGALLIFGAVGLALVILAIVFYATGKLRRVYLPGENTGPYAEGFALYFGGFIIFSLLVALLMPRSVLAANWLTFLFIPAVAIYLLCRRQSWANICNSLGWHMGRGLWREMGAGIAGYIAGLPFVFLALLLTTFLANLTHQTPQHPIQDMPLDTSWQIVQVILLASVWAPLVEETMFRGALFHHLRGRCGWWISALIVSLIFAVVHPQGWLGVPVLSTIAMVFAALREWRGSLIAPITAHALNNGLAVLFMCLLMR